MADPHHLEILAKGVEIWNQWRKDNSLVIPDLGGANLREAHLDMVDFRDANLEHIDLYRAMLRGANLCRASLHMAHLYRTDFSGADLCKANLKGADMVRAHLIGTSLREADLRWVKLGDSDMSGADLTKCAVYGVCAWDIKLENVIQSDLAITKDGTPTVTVDDLETAQLIHMLRDYKKILNVIDSVKKKGVLILGRFSECGIDLLQSIAASLREYGYLPMIFDFDRPDTSDYTATVKLLAALSRFVIVEMSGPSVPQELYATVPHFHIPFVPIIDQRQKVHFIFRDYLQCDWVLSPILFGDEADLLTVMPTKIITPAEEKLKELREKYDERLKDFNDLNVIGGDLGAEYRGE